MLAINTAFNKAQLILKTQKGCEEIELDANCKHSENVLKSIDILCQKANIDILQVGTVAVVVGPGSFTGLRIGVAIAKALGCVNKDLKFLPLSSLKLFAYIVAKQGKTPHKFACAMNALSGLYFVAYFDEKGILLEEEKMIDSDQFSQIKCPIYALEGDIKDKNLLEISVSCEDLINFALSEEKAENFVNADALLPKYIRLSQAEDNLLKKKKKD